MAKAKENQSEQLTGGEDSPASMEIGSNTPTVGGEPNQTPNDNQIEYVPSTLVEVEKEKEQNPVQLDDVETAKDNNNQQSCGNEPIQSDCDKETQNEPSTSDEEEKQKELDESVRDESVRENTASMPVQINANVSIGQDPDETYDGSRLGDSQIITISDEDSFSTAVNACQQCDRKRSGNKLVPFISFNFPYINRMWRI